MTLADGAAETALVVDDTISTAIWGSLATHTPRGYRFAANPANFHPTALGGEVTTVGYLDGHAQLVPLAGAKEYSVSGSPITSYW